MHLFIIILINQIEELFLSLLDSPDFKTKTINYAATVYKKNFSLFSIKSKWLRIFEEARNLYFQKGYLKLKAAIYVGGSIHYRGSSIDLYCQSESCQYTLRFQGDRRRAINLSPGMELTILSQSIRDVAWKETHVVENDSVLMDIVMSYGDLSILRVKWKVKTDIHMTRVSKKKI